jgi:D-cysteine desulfhydrase family pyridoxal phosphate-dependent enzyme
VKRDTLPRFPILTDDTPLEPLPRFSREVGAEVWIKRDDLTGLGLGGNKLRKLEFLIGEAMEAGCDLVITGGSPQSNHARLTAAVAAKAGFEAWLLFAGRRRGEFQGNLLLDDLLGARMYLTGKYGSEGLLEAMEEKAREAREAGRKPFVIPVGGSTPSGDYGYVLAWEEMERQRTALGLPPFDEIVVAVGTGGTLAGLAVGGKLADSPTRLVGISVWESKERIEPEVLGHAGRLAEWLGIAGGVHFPNITVEDRYIGTKYGVPSPDGMEAIRLLARTEGIFADPVYTGKALAGLVNRVKTGESAGKRVLFWHTGGVPALFTHATSFVRGD